MADLVMGAMPSIIPKLYQLLEKECKLQSRVKERISSLTLELELAQAALRKVAQVPWDQLDEQVQIWARQVREASYDMDDVLDTFLVCVDHGPESADEKEGLLKPLKKMANLFKKSKARRKISGDVEDIMSHLQEVKERCCRYKVDDIMPRQATLSSVDPRLAAMYMQVNKLVGMDKSSGELMSLLQTNPQRGDVSGKKTKIVSISGVGGLGKTTLAKVVYDKIKGDFDCAAFVPVGRNPDLKKIFKDILIDLDKERFHHFIAATFDERQLIDLLRNFFLEDSKKRYLIVIDDIWEIQSWETIKLAVDDDKNCGGTIIITTRKLEVATKADEVYKLQPLPYDSSRELLNARIYGHEGRCVDNQPDEISKKFIRKCGGIPLAIITLASLLVGKSQNKWSELYNTIDFGSKDNREAETTMKILSFSYYDLPSHLKTCLLYLSAFPEDSVIGKGSLVWKWVAEGFVQEIEGVSLFEIGEGYFNDLVNRSMIQAVEHEYYNIIVGCRVHDVVLDFIRSMSREEMFFTIQDNDQGTLLQQSIVRRLTKHNRTIRQTHETNNHFEMPKLRSFVALNCVIDTWAPISSFTLLRVLAIENCKPRDGYYVRVEHLGHLLHLRYLSLRATRIKRLPEEIGALRFLQTLDLCDSSISELPSSCSLLKRLLCLRIELWGGYDDVKVFSVEGMTSLEELEMRTTTMDPQRQLVKDLGCLTELRVLVAFVEDEESERDLVESLRHLHKLQSLTFYYRPRRVYESIWQPTELVFPCHLRYLSLSTIEFCKQPLCINAGCLPNLSHLELVLKHMDEQDLKALGGLPELRFLDLRLLCSSAAISNINDSDPCYFPKLRSFILHQSIVFFIVANKGDKTRSISFHIWSGEDDVSVMPFVSDDDEFQKPTVSAPDDELQGPPERRGIGQHGIAKVAYYLLAFFHLVLAFRKSRTLQELEQHPSIYSHGSAHSLNREDATAKSSFSDYENNGTICSKGRAAPRFMPNLQVLNISVRGHAMRNRYMDKLGWEYLSSLQEIILGWGYAFSMPNNLEASLRHAARVHPNRPMLRIN